ncbi:Glycosyltransferase [Rhynchospora pubera]|uniref:Glycosyltransferase n=1 Tax=Rhynchospora pubera TaxID=906938 RepID=A0AAV8DPC1_9POAL|nr:Glycosyltransferase [Rhynchospora pubera]
MANEFKIETKKPDQYHHFLIVVQPAQSHINPARYLAYRLLSIIPSCHVTVSTSIWAHSRMFPSLSHPNQEITISQVSFVPFSDGYDAGFDPSIHDRAERRKRMKAIGPGSLSSIIDSLAERGRRVTCIIQALFLPWVFDIALERGVPSILFWIQPVQGLSIYYNYFNGYESIILSHSDDQEFEVSIPGLFPLKMNDFPSFLTITSHDHPHKIFVSMFREIFESLDLQKHVTGSKPKILINSFEALEEGVLPSMKNYFDLYTIGPLIQSSAKNEEEKSSDIFKMDDENKHMAWLDSKPERSVVYVSFGGLTTVSKKQLEQVQVGLKDSELPYIWVVRKNSRVEGLVLEENSSNGIIVEWCDQVKVLSHASIGCFVTHHGWNSTLESLMCGVPMVGIPQWSDQPTNAKMAREIGVGVRGEVSKEEGVVLGSEIKRCLEIVMSDDAKGSEMRQNAGMWKEKVREAMELGGSSETNLRAFVEAIAEEQK